MAETIFINYRGGDSIGIPGRLHDRLTRVFGQKNVFMDDSMLNSQLAVCDVVLVVIGPNWLDAKDETGKRRLDNPDDFVVVGIKGALARDIRVIPVLVDGTQMPKESELPDPVKALVRCEPVEMRNAHFDQDAEALIEKMRKPLDDGSAAPRPWRGKAVGVAAAAALLILFGWGGYTRYVAEQDMQRTQLKLEEERKAVEVEADRKREQAKQEEKAKQEQQVKQEERAKQEEKAKQEQRANQEQQAKQEEQTKQEQTKQEQTKQEQTKQDDQQRLTALEEQERETKAAAETEAKRQTYLDAIKEGNAARSAGEFDKAIANFSEAIRLRPDDVSALMSRGNVYESKGDDDRAIGDYSEAIRINPDFALAFNNRGNAYAHKGNQFRAIADYTEAIRLYPNFALAFCNRGIARQKINNGGDNDDKARARQLDASVCR